VNAGYVIKNMGFNPHASNHHAHLIMNDAHESSIHVGLLLMLSKDLLYAMPHHRVVLMTATPQERQ
jgi:HrpA-like RNA helicase